MMELVGAAACWFIRQDMETALVLRSKHGSNFKSDWLVHSFIIFVYTLKIRLYLVPN